MLSSSELNELDRIKSTVSPTHVALGALRSESDNGIYPETVRRLAHDTTEFTSFKRNLVYRQILEHVTESQGSQYLEQIFVKWPQLVDNMERFKINDAIGEPLRFTYPLIGSISPTTLRYLKVAADLRELFGDLSGFSVAEIGGGYGGQFLLTDLLWELESWTLFDLDPVLLLISRYLECHFINSVYRATTLNRFDGRNSKFDLVISNYAFSELPKELQLRYIKKVLSKAERGYMTMNSGRNPSDSRSMSVAELCGYLPNLVVLDEVPLTFTDNYIVTWGAQ